MKLIVGGAYQGKLKYAVEEYGLKEEELLNGENVGLNTGKYKAVYNLHIYIRQCMKSGKDPEEMIYKIINKNKDIILITDEIGYGLVPVDAFEREYREKVGRICCGLASEADQVIRVVCGIGRKIKG